MTPASAAALSLSAQRFRALSDPTRLGMVLLMAQGEWCVCELASAVGVAQPLVSHHLKALGRAGFLHVRREGRWHHYALNRERLEDCLAWFRDALEVLDESTHLKRRCCSSASTLRSWRQGSSARQ